MFATRTETIGLEANQSAVNLPDTNMLYLKEE
jgi:hypothetical protein